MSESPQPNSALSNPLFRALWLASVGSGIGAAIHDTAAVWTLTQATEQAWMVTLYQSLLSLPLFLLALPAGALADIVDKRRLSFWVQLIGAAISGAMAVQALGGAGATPPWFLLGGAAALGAASAFGLPAWQALMPEVIDRSMMSSAITLGSLGINLSRAIGPFFGGYLVAGYGPAPAFALNSLSFLALAGALAFWRRPTPPPKPHAETVLSAIVAAVRHVRYSVPIRRVLWRHALFGFAGIAPAALLPLVVKSLDLPASSFGGLMGVYGLGGIASAVFLVPLLRRFLTVDQMTLLAGVCSALAIAAMPFARGIPDLAISLFFAGIGWLTSNAQLNVAGQSVFPHWVRARASAVHLLFVQGGIAAGAIAWGNLTERFDLSIALFSAAGLVASYVILTRLLPVDAALHADLSPVPHDHRHESLVLQPAASEGPVRVSVRYRIEKAREADFLDVIGALRDSRLRDGAYRWNLWRDLETPEIFWEVFLVGSWEEHLRQADRTTRHARDVEDRVLDCHADPTPPVVKHFLHVEPGSTRCLS